MPDRTLLDFIPAAAAADPETSHAAAAAVTASGARGEHCRRVLTLVAALPGRTAVELCAAQVGDRTLERHEVSRRLSDLLRAGLVRQGPARRCTVRPRSSMVTWFATGGPP